MSHLVSCLAIALAAGGTACAAERVSLREVDVDGSRFHIEVHAPAGPPAGAVVLAHGFLRPPASMAGYAEAIAGDGYLAIVPALPSRVDSRANGRALAGLVARLRDGSLGFRVERVVLAGFSAGGLSAMLAAGTTGVVGYVGLDAFDRPGGAGREAARALRVPAVLLHGPPAFCNAYNIAAPWRTVLPALERDRRIEGASHCDFEWPTDAACMLACGSVHPAAQAAIREEVREAVRRFLP